MTCVDAEMNFVFNDLKMSSTVQKSMLSSNVLSIWDCAFPSRLPLNMYDAVSGSHRLSTTTLRKYDSNERKSLPPE